MYYVLYPFAWILRMLYLLVQNYGVALILFSLALKLIMLPVNMKSKKNLMKQTRLTPKLKALEAKYGDDKLKYQQEMSQLYKDEGVKPLSGCLWTLVPLIFMIMLYGIVRQPMTYLMNLSADEVAAVKEFLISKGHEYSGGAFPEVYYASFVHNYFDEIRAIASGVIDINFKFLGLDISQIPNWKSPFIGDFAWTSFGLFLIPLISGGLNFLTGKLSNILNGSVAKDDKGKQVDDPTAGSMKTMLYMMPLLSVYIGFVMPAGISVYWIAQGLFNMLQEVILTRHYRKIYDAEDALKAERAAEEEALEAERARRREELKSGANVMQNPNTSKRKRKNQEKAMALPTVEGKLSEEEREELKQRQEALAEQRRRALAGEIPAERPFARGRSYDPDRFSPREETTGEPESTGEAEE